MVAGLGEDVDSRCGAHIKEEGVETIAIAKVPNIIDGMFAGVGE